MAKKRIQITTALGPPLRHHMWMLDVRNESLPVTLIGNAAK